MKFLFDQNISHKILKFLPVQFSNSSTVKKEGLINSSDRDIFLFARKNSFVIVTQDSDFQELNANLGSPPKIIWIRIGNLSTKEISRLLIENENQLVFFIQSDFLGTFQFIKST
jgi:predicted nuclease of predicted toxin-antitoxin system